MKKLLMLLLCLSFAPLGFADDEQAADLSEWLGNHSIDEDGTYNRRNLSRRQRRRAAADGVANPNGLVITLTDAKTNDVITGYGNVPRTGDNTPVGDDMLTLRKSASDDTIKEALRVFSPSSNSARRTIQFVEFNESHNHTAATICSNENTNDDAKKVNCTSVSQKICDDVRAVKSKFQDSEINRCVNVIGQLMAPFGDHELQKDHMTKIRALDSGLEIDNPKMASKAGIDNILYAMDQIATTDKICSYLFPESDSESVQPIKPADLDLRRLLEGPRPRLEEVPGPELEEEPAPQPEEEEPAPLGEPVNYRGPVGVLYI